MDALAGAGEIVVLDNLVRGRRQNLDAALESGRIRLVEADIRDLPTVNQLTAGMDGVFHLAAIRITQCAEDPRLANEVLVDGTFNVVEAAATHGVKKVVASSSASVSSPWLSLSWSAASGDSVGSGASVASVA